MCWKSGLAAYLVENQAGKFLTLVIFVLLTQFAYVLQISPISGDTIKYL